jgi:hypothetical protein
VPWTRSRADGTQPPKGCSPAPNAIKRCPQPFDPTFHPLNPAGPLAFQADLFLKGRTGQAHSLCARCPRSSPPLVTHLIPTNSSKMALAMKSGLATALPMRCVAGAVVPATAQQMGCLVRDQLIGAGSEAGRAVGSETQTPAAVCRAAASARARIRALSGLKQIITAPILRVCPSSAELGPCAGLGGGTRVPIYPGAPRPWASSRDPATATGSLASTDLDATLHAPRSPSPPSQPTLSCGRACCAPTPTAGRAAGPW